MGIANEQGHALWAAAAMMLHALACAPKASPTPATTTPAAEPANGGRDAREAPGEVLEAIVPLLDGGTLDLATLRGTPVVLALATTTDPSFAPLRTELEALIARHPERLALIVVATDPDPDLVPRTWPGGPGSVHVGWDPQGALATRLQVRTLPTIFVLDGKGRVVTVRGGSKPGVITEVASAADAAVADRSK